jgi:hypothetical protein
MHSGTDSWILLLLFQCCPFWAHLHASISFYKIFGLCFCLLSSGIAVSMVMKYADNIVKVYAIFLKKITFAENNVVLMFNSWFRG